ncbi:MAG: uncharacterized protein KVP18_000463 [Porospora cf. gigantea A]|uniref:uncharacterized protein n=1 Tax=Porospora cf. gigantea A TaxID=2853593 RepID=UPI003559CA13|nr:MAG: hypothetical protein KVP18_000463 [Porospora cf. gigantea A]
MRTLLICSVSALRLQNDFCPGPLGGNGQVVCKRQGDATKRRKGQDDEEHGGVVGRGYDYLKNGLSLNVESKSSSEVNKREQGGNHHAAEGEFQPLKTSVSEHFNNVAAHNGIKLPWWMVQTMKVLDTVQSFLASIKIMLPMPETKAMPHLADLKVSLFDTVQDTKALVSNGGREVISLVKVLTGGDGAKKALQTMLDISNRPMGLFLLKMTGSEFVCSLLASRESTSDETRNLALSVLARIRDVPASGIIADMGSGSFVHGNIVLPRPSRVFRGDKLWSLLDLGQPPDLFNEGWSISEEVPGLNKADDELRANESFDE